MAAPGVELHVALVTAMKGNGALMALVDGIYDKPPANPWGALAAYVSIGASDVGIDDAECVDGEEHNVQIDVWSRAVGQVKCKAICSAIKAVLHQAELVLDTNALVESELQLYRVFSDPDGLTTHGVLQFRIAIEAA